MVLGTLALVVLSACSGWNDDRGIGDAPSDQQPDHAVKVWPNADRFANVAAFCIGPNGIYTSTGSQRDAVDVIKDDKNCAEGGKLKE